MGEVFLTGGTGYMGSRLAPRLARGGCRVRMLVRSRPENIVGGVECVVGDPLDPASVAARVGEPGVFVHLVGVAHPSPSKAREFREIDLKSLRASVAAAVASGANPHFVFVSVAHPAPVMRAYVEIRRECEAIIRESGLGATILRPWYVTGPGHRWPLVLKPFYWLAERFPATREGARRLGLVTISNMLDALEWAALHPAPGVRVLDARSIQTAGYAATP